MSSHDTTTTARHHADPGRTAPTRTGPAGVARPGDPGWRLVDLDEAVEHLHRLGIDAHVAQTGGGCATVYAGAIDDGTPGREWSAVAGPGTHGGGRAPSTASLDEFLVGPDDLDAPAATDAGLVGARDAFDLARLIFEQVRHPDRPATPAELRALGFDPDARRVTDLAADDGEQLRGQRVTVTADRGAPLGVGEISGVLVALCRSSWGEPLPPPVAVLRRPDGTEVAVGIGPDTTIRPASTDGRVTR